MRLTPMAATGGVFNAKWAQRHHHVMAFFCITCGKVQRVQVGFKPQIPW